MYTTELRLAASDIAVFDAEGRQIAIAADWE